MSFCHPVLPDPTSEPSLNPNPLAMVQGPVAREAPRQRRRGEKKLEVGRWTEGVFPG